MTVVPVFLVAQQNIIIPGHHNQQHLQEVSSERNVLRQSIKLCPLLIATFV